MHFDNDLLIDAQGNIRPDYIRASAERRARSLYGSDCTALDIAYWTEKLFGLAEMKAEQFRRDLILRHARAA